MSAQNVADGETRVFIGQDRCGPRMNLNYYVVIRGKANRGTVFLNVVPVNSLKFTCTFPRCVDDENAINVNIQYKTLKPMKNHKVQVTIACGNPYFFREIICPNSDDWTDLTCIPKVKPYAVCENVQFYSIQLSISVHELAKTQCDLLYNDESFTDFNLSTENGSSVPVHRACMAAHSDVFKTMLNGEWRETAKGCLEIKGLQVTLDTLKHLKDYMYLGTVPDDGLRPLLLIADCYMIHDLRYQCVWKLASTVRAENLLDLIEFATFNKIADLTVAILTVTPKSIVHDVYVNLHKERNKPLTNKQIVNTDEE